MKWDRIEYDDATGYWWRRKLGNGEEVYCDSVSGVWVACWFSGGHDIEIGRAPTEDEAKAAAARWIGERIARFSNALAAGEQREYEDDGN